MKTVVITGSARGLGYELAKKFRKNNYNVVLSDIMEENLKKAKQQLLESIESEAEVISVVCDVTKENDLQVLMDETIKKFQCVDIWINNAGVNQPMIPIWEVDTQTIDKLIDIDLKSAVIGSKIAMNQMIKQVITQTTQIQLKKKQKIQQIQRQQKNTILHQKISVR